MTVDEARALKVGDYVASPHDTPAYRPRRLTVAPWVNADGTIARLSLHSYQSGAWVPPDAFIKAPGPDTQYRWDPVAHAFKKRGEPRKAVSA